MQMMTKTVATLGFVGAIAVSAPSPTMAQGVYFQGPGVEIGVGRPYYRERHYRHYDGPYAYYGRPYHDRRYYRSHRWDWE
jgi:hypothetical protein